MDTRTRPTLLTNDRTSVLRTLAQEGAGPRYDLVGEIGEGGMGAVYRAHDHDLDRDVALKALRPELAGDREFVARFLREAQATGQLQHPNIVPLHDLGLSADGTPWFTMQLVRGESLEGLIGRLKAGDEEMHRRFSFQRRLTLVQEICDALEYAHSQGVLHRDLKPSNVMLGPYGEVLVLDWGIAKRLTETLPEEVGEVTAAAPGTTAVGGFLGTLGFAAPEQIRGERPEPRMDVYALGALMYEFLGLRRPYAGETPGELIGQVLNEDPPVADTWIHPLQGRVPREVALIIERAMARDPEARFQSARQLREAIQSFLDGTADVVCVSTGMKRTVYRIAKAIDDYPIPSVLLAALLVVLPIVEAVVILMLW